MRIFGVDAGLSGAWAAVEHGRATGCGDMPVAGEGAQKRVSGVILADHIVACHAQLVVVEMSWPRPTDGTASAFRFGCSFGVVLGVAATLGVPVELVAPQTWKRHYRLIGTDKEASRAKALELCPHLAGQLDRKKDHNRGEAILIGMYAAATWDRTPLRIDAPPGPAGDARQRCDVPPPAASDT